MKENMSKNIINLVEQKDCIKEKKQCKNMLVFKSQKIITVSNMEKTFKDQPEEGCRKKVFRN